MIEFKNVSKVYNNGTEALRNLRYVRRPAAIQFL